MMRGGESPRGSLRRRIPELLLVLGLLLALGVTAAYLVGERERSSTRAPSAPSVPTPSSPVASTPAVTSSTDTSPTTAAQPPAPGPPAGPRVSALTPFAATVSWHTATPSVGAVSFGPASIGVTRSLAPTPSTIDHSVNLTGLAFSTAYTVRIRSAGAAGPGEATIDLTTPGPPSSPAASVRDGRILLDGQPWFPLLEYGECSTLYGSARATGITLFAANPCGGLQEQVDALHGGALSAGVVDLPGGTGAGTIGTFYPDEADGHGYTGAALPAMPPGLRFLTLTNHFFSGADPLPTGRAMYPGLVARADVVGFDLYPLQGWCRLDRLAAVFDAQRELVALAARKPTFQWIEAAGMNCPGDPATQVTAATVRAEAWLAIAGGAHGLGFFPAAWTAAVGGAISRVAAEVAGLVPVVLGAPLPGVEADSGLRAAAWRDGDTLYVVAINPGAGAVRGSVHVPGLGGKTLDVLEEGRQVVASGDDLADGFGPLEVHLYVART